MIGRIINYNLMEGDMQLKIRFIFSVLILFISFSALYAGDTSFYVSPSGDDSSPGTIDHPFLTPERAQRAVREARAASMTGNITVYLREGEYYLDSTLTFGPQDGGDDTRVVTWSAYENENVLLSGGEILTGWQNLSGDLWYMDIPEVAQGSWWFGQLFKDNHRMPRSRFPNGDSLMKLNSRDDVNYDLDEIDLPLVPSTEDLGQYKAEICALHIWNTSRVYIESSSNNHISTVNSLGSPGWHIAYQTTAQTRLFLEHAIPFIDQPGEWHCDASTGRLTYLAPPGEDPNTRKFIAPKLNTLIKAHGESGNPVKNLHFKNMRLEHTQWILEEEGFRCLQAAHYVWEGGGVTFIIPVAIDLNYAEKCEIKGCRIAHMAQNAVGIGVASHYNKVTGCEITDVGAQAVMIGYRGHLYDNGALYSKSRDWPDPSMAPVGNEVTNCNIHHGNVIYYGSCAVWTAFTKNTVISNNTIAHFPYTGVSIGFKWNADPTSMESCFVEYNHIHHCMEYLGDGAGIYALGTQPGSVLRGNVIHDIPRHPQAEGEDNNGFSMDEGCMNFLIEDCVVYNVSGTNLQWYRSWESDNTVRNNHMYPRGELPPDSILQPALERAGPTEQYAYVHDPSYWGLTDTKRKIISSPGAGHGFDITKGNVKGADSHIIAVYDIRGRKIGQWKNITRRELNPLMSPVSGCYIYRMENRSDRLQKRIITLR
ncbi:MAG: hypothetical protein GF401_03210 [Chitinivibrionales bacterium]|nr:hypothetical protein [Chitinivibrionales bacterium]